MRTFCSDYDLFLRGARMAASLNHKELIAALRQFDSDYRSEIVGPVIDWIAVPDGKYQVLVEDVTLCKAEPSGHLRLLWRLRINGTAMQNRIVWKSRPITSETLQRIKEDLFVCGLQLDRLSLLPARLEQLLDVELLITKRTSAGARPIFAVRRCYSN